MASRPENDEVRFDVNLAYLALAFAALTIIFPAIVAVLR